MARTQSFARDDVVRAARSLFWRAGYEGASIPDLERATGLSRSSIYNTFGSKRGLFDAAVQSYLDEIIRPRLQPLLAEPVSPPALHEYLVSLRHAFDDLDSLPATSGCLLINTAGAPIADDAHVARVIADYRAELRAAFVRGVTAAQRSLPEPERDALADTVTALVVASFALARVDPGQAAQTLDTAVALVDRPAPAAATPSPAREIRVSAAVITDADERLLLVRKAGTTAFMQPGGKPEPGENAAETLTRELAEELGLDLRAGALEPLGEFTAAAANEPGFLVVADVFRVEIGDQTPVPDAEIAELRWVSRAEAAGIEVAPLALENFLPGA